MSRTPIAVLILGLLLAAPALSPMSNDAIAGHTLSGLPHHEGGIQPGANILTGYAGTLGWIFESNTRTNEKGEPVLYASSHAHGSAPDVGEQVWLENEILVGVVVLKEFNATHSGKDWILIEIAEASREFVDYSVAYWTGPTGMPKPDEIRLDDVVCHYGWGMGYSYHDETRPRCGIIDNDQHLADGTTQLLSWPLTSSGGDSGSPVLHYETGQALGIIQGGLDRMRIVSICSMVEAFHEAGFDVSLGTAKYEPPEPELVIPSPYGSSGLLHSLTTECFAGSGAG